MLRILKSSSDGLTGHISCDLQIVETDGNNTITGALEVHGIHPDPLHLSYGGSIKLWLDGVHRLMQARHEARKKAAVAMADLQKLGNVIE